MQACTAASSFPAHHLQDRPWLVVARLATEYKLWNFDTTNIAYSIVRIIHTIVKDTEHEERQVHVQPHPFLLQLPSVREALRLADLVTLGNRIAQRLTGYGWAVVIVVTLDAWLVLKYCIIDRLPDTDARGQREWQGTVPAT